MFSVQILHGFQDVRRGVLVFSWGGSLKQTQPTEPTVDSSLYLQPLKRSDKVDVLVYDLCQIKALKTAVGNLHHHAFTCDTNISANCSLAP